MFSLEGNIGSGKSTLLAHLKKRTHIGERRVVYVPEPVDMWEGVCDVNGTNMIELFYSDKAKYGFAFQIMAFVSRHELLEAAIQQNPGAIIISERGLDADRIFASMLFDSGHLSLVEHRIYTQLFDCFNRIPSSGVIYLRCDPETAHKRCVERNRPGEIIPLEYLRDCHDRHEIWNAPTSLVLSGNDELASLDEHVARIVDYISAHI